MRLNEAMTGTHNEGWKKRAQKLIRSWFEVGETLVEVVLGMLVI